MRVCGCLLKARYLLLAACASFSWAADNTKKLADETKKLVSPAGSPAAAGLESWTLISSRPFGTRMKNHEMLSVFSSSTGTRHSKCMPR